MKKYRKSIYLFLFGIITLISGCSDEKDVLLVEPVERINELYITGAAVGWASKAMQKDAETPNVFTYELSLTNSDENKLFKFTREQGDWDKIRYLVPVEVDYNGYTKIAAAGEYDMAMVSQMAGNLRDHFWGIGKGADGKYRLTVDAGKLKLTIERIGDIP